METIKRYRASGLGNVLAEQGRMRQWVAAQARVDPSLIAHVVAGRRTVSEAVAQRISDALEVDFSLLFELSSESILYTEAVPA